MSQPQDKGVSRKRSLRPYGATDEMPHGKRCECCLVGAYEERSTTAKKRVRRGLKTRGRREGDSQINEQLNDVE